ncbi:MAG TPA: hypothetical protein VG759_14830 [Candidatus Angelobacter sp.]|jgi:hypothetical protein|nr:hypothetical protein [Candidatus Angelobacter sp.]
MPWMPVNSADNKGGDIAIGIIVGIGITAIVWIGMPSARSFLYSVPAAIAVALGLRYWHNRRAVDLIQLGYKDNNLKHD